MRKSPRFYTQHFQRGSLKENSFKFGEKGEKEDNICKTDNPYTILHTGVYFRIKWVMGALVMTAKPKNPEVVC